MALWQSGKLPTTDWVAFHILVGGWTDDRGADNLRWGFWGDKIRRRQPQVVRCRRRVRLGPVQLRWQRFCIHIARVSEPIPGAPGGLLRLLWC